jgi:23S rRNA pseudouridine955/2504/2580 synthase
MKEIHIGKNDAGQRLDRFLAKALPLLPASLAQKYIRLKRIKRNNARVNRDDRLAEGDVLQLYINDEFFEAPREDNAYLTVTAPKLHIVYEDEHILLVDKKPGVAVHPHDGAEYGRTLIDHIQAYLYAKREWRPREENAFTPALCNRIDRNTGGIVIAAKTAEALRILNQKIKDRELDKRY